MVKQSKSCENDRRIGSLGCVEQDITLKRCLKE
jgi:hypothetical protein